MTSESVDPSTTRRGNDRDKSSRSRSRSIPFRRKLPISDKSHASEPSKKGAKSVASKKSIKSLPSKKSAISASRKKSAKSVANNKGATTAASAKSDLSMVSKQSLSKTSDHTISSKKKRGTNGASNEITACKTGDSETDLMSHMGRLTTLDVCATNSLLDYDYEVEGLTVKQLPWTFADTNQVKAQLSFLQGELLGGKGAVSANVRLWKEGMEDLENKIDDALAESLKGYGSGTRSKDVAHSGSLSRDEPLLRKLSSTMHSINLVNVPKLSKLMKANLQAGDCIEGKDVLLFCGETGAGKTTTMQVLLGTTFEEIEVDGFIHFGVTSYADPLHAEFRTSYTQEPTTRSLQAATVTIKGKEIAVCDMPSYDVANCLEEDIALGVGMVQALQRAKSVRPVVVLSRDGMGNRFGNLANTMKIMLRLFNVTEKVDWKPFQYVFTHYDRKHRSLLHKQFEALTRNPPKIGEGHLQDLFDAFIEDIAEKTSPVANVICPLDDHSANALAVLTEDTEIVKANPLDLCAKFASEFSIKQLHLQMQIQLQKFRGQLLQEDYLTALKSLARIKDVASLFPELHDYVGQAKEAILQQVAQIWVLIVRSIGKEDYSTGLYRMEQLSSMANDVPEATECSDLGREMLSQSISEPIAEKEYGKAIHRMILLNNLQKRFPDASEAVDFALQSLRETIVIMIEKKEFDTAVDIVRLLGRAEPDISEAFTVAQHGLHLIREHLMSIIEAENYEDGMKLTMKVSEMGSDFAEANGCVRHILKIVRKRIDQSVQFGDFVKSAFLLRNLSQLGSKPHDGREHVEHAFDAAAQHVCELRMEVVNAFEALLKVKDQKMYSQLLEYASTSMGNLMKSEPMRLICSEYYKNYGAHGGDGYKANYLVILCTPKDSTSEEFCVAQVRHLLESVSTDLFKLENEKNTMGYLMANRKVLLSVLLRLRAANLVFQDSPWGNVAATMYENAFAKFQALIESILSSSEASFDSSMEMKEFEFQAWFLAFLIQGFTKDSRGADDSRSADVEAMDQLDHRRVTLMLRFENEIAETMDLLSNYVFPEFKQSNGLPPDFVAYIQEVKLRDLEAPRQLLLSLSQAPQLCKMMATMLNAQKAQEAVVSLDKTVVDLFRKMVEYFEEAYGLLIQTLKVQRNYGTIMRDARIMYQTIKVTIRPEFTGIQNWSDDAMPGLEHLFLRLAEVEVSLEKLIAKLQERLGDDDGEDISPVGFFFSIFSGPLTCSCFRGDDEDVFLATLPLLSPTELPSTSSTRVDVLEGGSSNVTNIKRKQSYLFESFSMEASQASPKTEQKGKDRLLPDSERRTTGTDLSDAQGITRSEISPSQSITGMELPSMRIGIEPTLSEIMAIDTSPSTSVFGSRLSASLKDDYYISLVPDDIVPEIQASST
jgi:flagellar biosynthesis GTPase FlhF